jgi:NDP-sugar pyrophosphorylase family protein|tara:strand:- start:227 stop:928 length:702 start_codon:yes stop_codon:yes gene_type:complete
MSDLSQVTAVILAGGLGTRLRKVITNRPKVLAEINGKPFLYYLFDQLTAAGIKKLIVSTGYMAEKIDEIVGSSYKSLQVSYSREKIPLGTGGALKLAGQAVTTKYCLVMNGDSYTDFDFDSLLINHLKLDDSIIIVVKSVEDSSRYGNIHMDEQNNILKFTEKGGTPNWGLINTGVYLMSTSVLQEIPEKIPCSLEYDFFPSMIGQGICGYKTEGRFIDIGTPESYAQAEYFF